MPRRIVVLLSAAVGLAVAAGCTDNAADPGPSSAEAPTATRANSPAAPTVTSPSDGAASDTSRSDPGSVPSDAARSGTSDASDASASDTSASDGSTSDASISGAGSSISGAGSSTAAATPTTVVELGAAAFADCAVVIGVIGEVVAHPDTAEAVNADPADADELATREAFDAVAVRFGALELRDPAVAAAAALVGQRALDIALAEGTATGLIEGYAESFVALSDLCAAVADEPPPETATSTPTEGHQ